MPLVTIPKLIDNMNRSEKYVLNKLKFLYMAQNVTSYLYLEPKIKNLMPDFILIDPLRGVMIIEVKAWSLDYIQRINQKEVVTIKGEILENPSFKSRKYYNILKNIFKKVDKLVDINNNLKFNLYSTLVFTELKKEDIVRNNLKEVLDCYPTNILYKDDVSLLNFDRLFLKGIREISSQDVDIIRSTIFPEIKIFKNNDKEIDKRILTLDIEQERFSKNIPFGHYMITGFPGSGKSIVLVSRAIYLAQKFPKWKILILTYNKILKLELQKRVERIKKDLKKLNIDIGNIEISTFHQKAYQLSNLAPQDIEDNDEFWKKMIVEDAIKNAKDVYDAILVDEYQDFYKEWFKLILKMLKVHTYEGKKVKNLFLAGDRLQSIYNPKDINWKQDIGLDMRGRSKLLKKSYRIKKEHLELGLYILSKDKRYKEEIEKFYEINGDIFLRNITDNSIEIVEGDDSKVIEKLKNIFRIYKYEDILLIAPNWKRADFFKKSMPLNLQKYISSNKEIILNRAIFTTYYSAKGIESKVVVIVDVDKIVERKLLYVALTRASFKIYICAKSFEENEITKDIKKIISSKEPQIAV